MTTKERAHKTFAIYEKARIKNGVTDYHVAKATGIRASTICDWKHGRTTPKIDKLVKIAAVLGIPVEVFFVG